MTTSEKFLEEVSRAKGNAAYFAEAFLQIKPFPYQESFLTDE